MRLGYRTCFHTLYDEKKMYEQDLALKKATTVWYAIKPNQTKPNQSNRQFFMINIFNLFVDYHWFLFIKEEVIQIDILIVLIEEQL